jgi:hypothetical protein
MDYKCLRCGYTSIYKKDVKKHLNKKKTCKIELLDIDIDKCIKMLDESEKDIIKAMEEQIRQLRKQVVTPKDCTTFNGDKNINNSYNNNIYNTNIHINVNSFEKTDYTVLKDKIHTCIKNGKVDEAKLIKLLHFNKDAPQNHNIKIENKRENRIKVYNGIKFEESEYNGKEGIFKFSQDTLKKTGNQEFVENDDKAFDAIEKTKDENYTLNRNEKSQNVGKISTVLYNGID